MLVGHEQQLPDFTNQAIDPAAHLNQVQAAQKQPSSDHKGDRGCRTALSSLSSSYPTNQAL